jgi:dolichol-phosphate mannosyltransferase
MIREGHDVVIASRYQPQSQTYGVPWVRRLTSYAGSLLIRCLFPTRGVRDFTCGYRTYRADVLRFAMRQYGDHFVDQDGFECMVDILLKLRRLRVIFGEVPIILRYDLKQSGSKMRLLKTARSTLMLLLQRRCGG